jgi:hypothetical protein
MSSDDQPERPKLSFEVPTIKVRRPEVHLIGQYSNHACPVARLLALSASEQPEAPGARAKTVERR